MRLTTKRNGKNVIPMLMAVCGLNLPYWRIDRADDLHSYLSGDAADKLAAYEDAEEQGRLVILPCKVGDTLFINDWSEQCGRDTQFACRVQGISLSSSRNDVILHFGGYPIKNVWGSEIGKTIFRTREEADAALEARNGTTD